jgi:putative lipase involved disintegration of autophagic bodies
MTPEEKADFVNLFSGPAIRSHAHFRYPVDGNWSDLEETFHATLDEMFGPDSPNSAQNRWVRKLRHFGLIR